MRIMFYLLNWIHWNHTLFPMPHVQRDLWVNYSFNKLDYFVSQEEFCNTGIQDTEDLDKLKHQVDIFRNDMATFLMPWILDTPKNLELDEYDSLIPELANKVDKVKGVRNIYALFDITRVIVWADTVITHLTWIWGRKILKTQDSQ